jgi:hypothetical protein
MIFMLHLRERTLMRNLLKAVALAAVVLGVPSAGQAEILAECKIRCTSSTATPSFLVVTVDTSLPECCQGYEWYCPPGYTGWPFTWNGERCSSYSFSRPPAVNDDRG